MLVYQQDTLMYKGIFQSVAFKLGDSKCLLEDRICFSSLKRSSNANFQFHPFNVGHSRIDLHSLIFKKHIIFLMVQCCSIPFYTVSSMLRLSYRLRHLASVQCLFTSSLWCGLSRSFTCAKMLHNTMTIEGEATTQKA